MCGIIGYKGSLNACQLVFEGLKNLEYRGYDSWGMAYLREKGSFGIIKKVGKIANFKLNSATKAEIAIGHTRWATHGNVSTQNAHPLFSQNHKIAVVHNGIIENYEKLREMLKKQGFKFGSQTDTETIPHLIEAEMKKGNNFFEATRKAALQLEGRFAFLALNSETGQVIAARNGSPLVAGISEKGNFIASDVPAFLKHTDKVIYLDDRELAILGTTLEIFDLPTGKLKQKKIQAAGFSPEQAELGSFRHYMLKEILEQKQTIYNAVREQNPAHLQKIAELINSAHGTYLVGCGTAGRVCLAGTYIFSKFAKKHINFAVASEFPSYHDFLTPQSLVIAISQSGETADTLEAIETAKRIGAKVISIVNVPGSTMCRLSDEVIYTNCGPEKAVASTKAATSQLAVLYQLAFACSGKLEEGKRLIQETCMETADLLTDKFQQKIKTLAKKIKKSHSIYIIGRGLNFPMALESAIKLQEVSYIHAEGFAAGELKHGPIALISKGTPCIVLCAEDETKSAVLSNAMEIKSRGGFIIGISPKPATEFDFHIEVPDLSDTSCIPNIIPVQLLAYYLAVLLKHDPDKPRNLAKSVTVK